MISEGSCDPFKKIPFLNNNILCIFKDIKIDNILNCKTISQYYSFNCISNNCLYDKYSLGKHTVKNLTLHSLHTKKFSGVQNNIYPTIFIEWTHTKKLDGRTDWRLRWEL